jgi:hypothetical protein
VPTLFERLDTGVGGTDLSVKLTVQTGQLGSLATTVRALITNPPSSLDELTGSLGDLPVPDLGVGPQFTGMLGDLRAAVPTDISAVIGPLTTGLGQLAATVGPGLTSVLAGALDTVLAVQRLATMDFRCLGIGGGASANGAPPPPENGGGPPPEDGAATSGGGTATATAATTASASRVNEVLDRLPTPLTIPGLLGFVATLLDDPERDTLFPHVFPLLDGVRDPLVTLVAWDDMTGAEIRADFASTLSASRDLVAGVGAGAVGSVAADVVAATSGLPATALAQVADGLAARLQELADAVAAGNLAGTGPAVGALNALLDQYDVLRADLEEPLADLADLSSRLGALPDDLEDRMTIALGALGGPGATIGVVELLAGLLASEADGPAIQALEDQLSAFTAWLQDLVAKLDLSALEEPLGAVADGARSAVDAVDDALVGVTLQAQALFAELESVLDGVDVEALRAQVEQAIGDFGDALVAQLTELFAPARDGVHEVIDAIDEGVDAFDPADIVGALQDVIAELTAVLDDPDVASAIGSISTTIETTAQELEALSFAPIVDGIVEAIDAVAELLRGIDTAALGVPGQLALQAALALLPEDLTPATDPLIADFGALVETGPVPLVASVRAQPERLLVSVRGFEPGTLVSSALSGPFDALVAQMDEFKPSALLAPVEQELDSLKTRLKQEASPGLALAPLEPLFDDLLEALDELRPAQLVAPLEEVVTGVVDGIIDALPVDETFAAVDSALAEVQNVVDIGNTIESVLERLRDTLAAFENPAQQLGDWIDSILAKVEPLADDGSLAAAMAALDTAIDGVRAPALESLLAGGLTPALATLDGLDATGRLTAVVQAYRKLSTPALAALPDSPAKAAIVAAVNRFDPLDPVFGEPYRAVAGFRNDLLAAKQALTEALAGWDDLHHAPGATLAELAASQPVPAQLAARVREHLEARFVQPLTAAFSATQPIAATLAAMARQVEHLMEDVNSKLGAILSGPDSLTAIRDAVQELVDRLRAFDLGFLTQSLNEVFDNVRGKLDAANPAHLRELVDGVFDDMLATLTLAQILPPADVAALDAAYADVRDKLKQLDPGKLVTEVVQPEFEATIVPLLAAFDLTPVLDALVARLQSLDEELRVEMDRVNEAWQRLRGAIPSISPLDLVDIDLDVDIDIGVGSPF